MNRMIRKIPKDVKDKILSSLDRKLREEINPNKDPNEIAEDFNRIFKIEFEEKRRTSVEGGRHNMPVVFIGQYKINPASIGAKKEPEVVLYKSIGFGCSPIPIDPTKSIIARAVINGTHQHIPDVSRDPSHWECSGEASHEEVYPIFSWGYTSGNLKGYQAVVGVHDIDFADRNALTLRESRLLGNIIYPIGELIFPGQPEFQLDHKSLIYRRPVMQRESARNLSEGNSIPGRYADSVNSRNMEKWKNPSKSQRLER